MSVRHRPCGACGELVSVVAGCAHWKPSIVPMQWRQERTAIPRYAPRKDWQAERKQRSARITALAREACVAGDHEREYELRNRARAEQGRRPQESYRNCLVARTGERAS